MQCINIIKIIGKERGSFTQNKVKHRYDQTYNCNIKTLAMTNNIKTKQKTKKE